MKHALATCVLALGYAVAACGRAAPPPPPPARAPAPTHYLDEWFDVGAARCRIERAERTLLEQHVGEGQVAEDVLMVDTRWACIDAAQKAVDVATLLPKHGPVSWLDDRHATHLRSPRRGARNHVYFAVPTQHDGLLRPRKFDAGSGAPEGTRELREARITLAGHVVVAPWPRIHDQRLDARIDQLVRTLATDAAVDAPGERDALALASAVYRSARATFAPRRVALRRLETVEGQPRLVLGFERSTSEQLLAQRFELAFELAIDADGPRVLRMIDPEGARAQLACAEARRSLAARVARPGTDAQCNVVKTLLPGRCDELSPALLAQALEVGTRCGDAGAVGLDPDDVSVVAPRDLEVQLRRGRSLASLDRSPRYQLTLRADGEVHFQGEHWVSRIGPSSGRTSARLLGALYAHVMRLGWFERPEPHTTRRCHADEYGDVLRIHADGRERGVRDREGCRQGFSARELESLRLAIERVGGVDAWTAPGVELGRREDQIWVVAAE